jgi:uncharacterized 2Fe-2S/4Fe-4S cluster protein (DUF4445 family)
MDNQQMKQIAQAYKAQMLAIDPDFPITIEAMALSVWTQISPMGRYEIMSKVEKMPKSLPAKQKACIKKIIEIIE